MDTQNREFAPRMSFLQNQTVEWKMKPDFERLIVHKDKKEALIAIYKLTKQARKRLAKKILNDEPIIIEINGR